ncbi:TELO2-interacting protein 1 homolog isoform X2 [Hyla sarda]|uniref:TELO2-interacting protein 1 homolog isoform X2 n=1 Tax=Hyla sarda TaxID=327740 RepID=UPI0024C44BE7|nr:TELO2-interacting protein 1 homolog isoform X2 [Hyla sarda]
MGGRWGEHFSLMSLKIPNKKEAMADETSPPSAFEGLRPFCVRLTMEQTAENVKNLRTQISSTEASALQDLLDYVLFPLRFSLKTPGPKRPGLVQAVVECISYILSIARLRSPITLQEMFSELCRCLPPEPHQQVPEELKLAVVVALKSLLRCSGAEVLDVLYKPPMLPEMGFTITLLLRLAEQEKSREIRLEALNCLERLLMPDLKEDTALGDLFASFLPGVCTVLTRIICGDPKQGYRITTGAVRLWAGAVSSVMSDESLALVPEEKTVYPGLPVRVAELMVHRDRTWAKSSVGHLLIQLEKITERCTDDPHWRVRLALVELACLLHARCWNSLGEAMGNLLRILVGHMSDDRPEVKARTREILLEISKEGPSSRTLGEVLSESLHSLTVTLPRLLRSQDDQGKLHTLALFLGYLQLLGPRLTFTLHSPAHLQRLSTALVQTLELDLHSVKIVEERLPSPVAAIKQHDVAHTGIQQKTFRFFRDPRILSNIQSVCRLLGYYGDFYLLTDHFLALYRAQILPATIVLNQLVLGAAGIDVEALNGDNQTLDGGELLEAIRPLLEEYTDPTNWYLLTCQDSDEVVNGLALLRVGGPPSKPAISDMNANAWKICLQMEGIACFAQALGTSFRPLLISALYPLLEKVGDPSLMVSGAALVVLESVSRACGYKDVSQLIELNSDYLASEVSVGLRRLQLQHGGAAHVLHAMLDNCGPSLLPLLYELVQDLLPALDQSQNEGAKVLLPVLNSLVTRLGKWFPLLEITEQPATNASIQNQPDDGSLAQEMTGFLQDYIEQHCIAMGDIEEEEAADVLPPSEEDDDGEKQPLPTHVQIAKEVAEKSTHFLSHSDTQLRIQAVDTLRLSLIPLHSHSDVLLPLAHKIWPCLVKRLLRDEPLVLLRAFQMLVSLAALCKDFIRQRVCKEALPAFLASLRSQGLVSRRAGPVYSHTLGFKLQKAILDGLGTLCVDLALGDGDLLEVIDTCVLYLSARQPKQLQEAAIRTLLSLSQLDPDMVWLHLCEWQCPPEVPHSSLVPLSWKAKPRDEYTQNVCNLLQNLQGP